MLIGHFLQSFRAQNVAKQGGLVISPFDFFWRKRACRFGGPLPDVIAPNGVGTKIDRDYLTWQN